MSSSSAADSPASALPPASVRRLVVVGGGTLPDSVVSEIVRLAKAGHEGRGRAQILVCTLASQDPEAGRGIAALFEARGLSACLLDFVPAGASCTEKEGLTSRMREAALAGEGLSALCEADAVFFTGGDQRLILDVLRGTPFEAMLKARWHSGELLVSGTSAGLQVCSEVALTGDFHNADADADTHADDIPFRRVAAGHVVTKPGFGFLRGVILDQHFLRRQRQNRLFSACLDNPGMLGVGVDESTALVVEDAGDTGRARPRVVGTSCVFYVDTLQASLQKDATGNPISTGDLRCGFVWEGGLFPFVLELG